MTAPEFEFYGYDGETIAEYFDDDFKAEWAYIGEGIQGEYSGRPDDEQLLRFYFYVDNGNGWEEVEDASCCTNMPLNSDRDLLESSLEHIFTELVGAVDGGYSVKKTAEGLSWLAPEDFA